ncbi:MAG: hypothetical protein ACQKBW_10235 [Puniceicoccales bacterium]
MSLVKRQCLGWILFALVVMTWLGWPHPDSPLKEALNHPLPWLIVILVNNLIILSSLPRGEKNKG